MDLLQRHSDKHKRGSNIARPYYLRREADIYSWDIDFPIQSQEKRGAKQTVFKLEFLLSPQEIEEFKDEVGSSFNGALPLEIKVGKDNVPHISLKKSGKNTKLLDAKTNLISSFVAKRIHFNYIPAVRTDKEAIQVVRKMLLQELRVIESDSKYLEALKTIQEIQQPILNELAQRIQEPLSEFLPTIKSVLIEISEPSKMVAYNQDFNIIIDDGVATNIEYKGDGIKSLAALGLLKNNTKHTGASIIAIEEPESHLHSGAIHQLNEIIKTISLTNQVILTTHNPLFVDREKINTNIIVSDGKATPAKGVKYIRDILGVRASDNLTNANFVLVVEGSNDVTALKSILPKLSSKIAKTLKDGALVIDSLGGASNLRYKVTSFKSMLCTTHSLLDNDEPGRNAVKKALDSAVIKEKDYTLINCKGMSDSEFEDCIDISVYKERIHNEYGVLLDNKLFSAKLKWSKNLENAFKNQGKLFDEALLKKIKADVAEEIENSSNDVLNNHRRSSIDKLVENLEEMIGRN